MFIHKTKSSIFIILIYVDDILVTGSNHVEVHQFTTKLNKMFSLKDLGNLHYFLGLYIFRYEIGLFISQKRYIQELLSKFNMVRASSSPTLIVSGKQIVAEKGKSLVESHHFQEVSWGTSICDQH